MQYSCGTGMLYTGYYFHGYILCFQQQIRWFAGHLLVQNLCIRCMVTSSRDVHRTLTEERQSVAHTREYLREQQRGLKRRRTALQHAHHKWSDDMKTFRTRQVCVCVQETVSGQQQTGESKSSNTISNLPTGEEENKNANLSHEHVARVLKFLNLWQLL